MDTVYVIRYRYPGTTNGVPVGDVYALDVGTLSPGSWSYTKDPLTATAFPNDEDARAEVARHSWPDATVEKVDY